MARGTVKGAMGFVGNAAADATIQSIAIGLGLQDRFSYGRLLLAGSIGAVTNQFSRACFTGDMQVITRRGWVRWDSLQKQDQVASCDENDPQGPIEFKQVEEIFTNVCRIWHILVDDKVLRTTGEHPFYVLNKGWIAAQTLQPGDLLRTDGNKWLPVSEEFDTGVEEKVYNCRVADYHTYFVGMQAWGFGVWAHNLCAGDHHMIPHALGSRVSYGDAILTPLSAVEHTHLHRALNDFLRLRTRTLATGQVVDMYARAGNPGTLVRRTFSQTERLDALDMFYRNYRGGMHYSAFSAERTHTLSVPGRFI